MPRRVHEEEAMSTRAGAAAKRAAIKEAIDRWIRINGSVTTGELFHIAALARHGEHSRRFWIYKITTDGSYHREKIPGSRALRITFARHVHSEEER
jgi:hypothetical protein